MKNTISNIVFKAMSTFLLVVFLVTSVPHAYAQEAGVSSTSSPETPPVTTEIPEPVTDTEGTIPSANEETPSNSVTPSSPNTETTETNRKQGVKNRGSSLDIRHFPI